MVHIQKDFWEYDPAANTWTQKADFGGTARDGAVGFSIGSKGYIGTGDDGSSLQKTSGSTTLPPIPGHRRPISGGQRDMYAVGFSIGSKGYIGTGRVATPTPQNTKDFWEYSPSIPAVALYFPHIATSIPWQTEIAIINTGDQTVTGTLRALSDEGQLVDFKAVTLPAHGRRQINVANEFANHTNIGYIIFDSNAHSVQGYTKFYVDGTYRTAIPAVREGNTSEIYIPHIASSVDWWTGISLLNTTSEAKVLTITFSDGRTRNITLAANQHDAFSIRESVQ